MDARLKDIRLHLILIGIIIVLAATTAYFFYNNHPVGDNFQQFITDNLEHLRSEQALQNMPEVIPPGGVKAPILIYHSVRPHSENETELVKYYSVAPESLEKQFKYLKDNHYAVIKLEDLVSALNNKTKLPPKPVVLTFDDGWENQYKYAYPILKEYNYTATFFVYTDALDYDKFLTWQEINEMDDAGMTIAGHTKSHPYLYAMDDLNKIRDEIIGSKGIIQDRLGKPVTLFAYPFGHYNDNIIKILKENGFRAARSTYKGIYHSPQDLFTMKGIEATDDFDKFVKDLGK